jgi:hypothetical protein
MSKKPDLKQLMDQRNPLRPETRQIVKPVDLYNSSPQPEQAHTEPPKGQSKSMQAETKKRYGTYLSLDLIKAVQRYAFDNDIPDYQVVQQALEEYLKKHSKQ